MLVDTDFILGKEQKKKKTNFRVQYFTILYILCIFFSEIKANEFKKIYIYISISFFHFLEFSNKMKK
jgi:hypothetical protein